MGHLYTVPTAGSAPWEGEREATARSLEPLPCPGEEVLVRRGAVTLSGFLLTPDRPGPHPAAVLIHGSGPTSVRAYWRPPTFPFWKDIAEFLGIYARMGRVWRMGYLGRVLSYAPREDLLQVSQPFLALFAGNDRLVHAEKNARLLRQHLERSKSPAWFIEVVPGANHLFRPSDFCEARVERRWVDGFWEALNKPEFWRHVLEA